MAGARLWWPGRNRSPSTGFFFYCSGRACLPLARHFRRPYPQPRPMKGGIRKGGPVLRRRQRETRHAQGGFPARKIPETTEGECGLWRIEGAEPIDDRHTREICGSRGPDDRPTDPTGRRSGVRGKRRRIQFFLECLRIGLPFSLPPSPRGRQSGSFREGEGRTLIRQKNKVFLLPYLFSPFEGGRGCC
jgi:hypothetical protein